MIFVRPVCQMGLFRTFSDPFETWNEEGEWFMFVSKFRKAFARWLCKMTWVYRDNH